MDNSLLEQILAFLNSKPFKKKQEDMPSEEDMAKYDRMPTNSLQHMTNLPWLLNEEHPKNFQTDYNLEQLLMNLPKLVQRQAINKLNDRGI
jgi:hypothetical protein